MLSLLCYVSGDDSRRAFIVKIEEDETVAALKEYIKEKKRPKFDDIPADSLDLWNKPVPSTRNLKKDVEALNLVDDDSLYPHEILSDVFPSELEKRTVHIIINCPQPVISKPPLALLELNCLVSGDDRSHIFKIEILDTKTVSDLRESIKEKNKPTFDHIPAHALIIWKVSVPINEDLQENIKELDKTLAPEDLLLEVFPTPPVRRHLHIVVKAPARPGSRVRLSSILHDELGELRRIHIEKLPRRAPSTLGQPSEFHNLQRVSALKGPAFHFDRPPSAATTIPPTLHHPIFGKFIDDCQMHVPTREDNALVLALSALSQIFENETARAAAFREILKNHGIMTIATGVEGTEYKTDGDMQYNGLRYLIIEVKLEIGSTGAEPLFQAILYYLESMRKQMTTSLGSPLPCLIIYLFVGAHVGFAAAVYTDRPNIEVLTPPLPLFSHPTHVGLRAVAARHIGALKNALHSLHYYYEHELPVIDKLERDLRPNPRYPYQSSYRSLADSTLRRFKYILQVPQKLVFFGQTEDDEKICIKFVRSYSTEAHEKCAEMGCAPMLRGFEHIAGGWNMVVMDIVTEGYCEFEVAIESPIGDLFRQMREKLTAFHEAGYVHGDIRDINIKVQEDSSGFMFLDFDWAGKIGEARYPANVYRGPDLWRPEGAYDGELITAEHDSQMLAALFRHHDMDALIR
ncbi:hypothetical protein BYT27DRAFT_7173144 [Phlegmacium glaucopus]|nr:hypothetical protein BYT27DRAFT_7173144 [Phlegmacium glaucopus]